MNVRRSLSSIEKDKILEQINRQEELAELEAQREFDKILSEIYQEQSNE